MELRGLTSVNGFSAVLNTSNPFVKILWICFFLILFSFFLQNIVENINDYYQYTVITNIEYVNQYPMTLPAFTLCLSSSPSFSTNLTLDKSLLSCSISEAECGHKDFYTFQTRLSFSNNSYATCYVLNYGRNSSGHFTEIKSTKSTEFGYVFNFYLPKDHFLLYYINDGYVNPTSSEISRFVLPGTLTYLRLEKTVESKLEFPFNDCSKLSSLPDSHLVRQLSEANYTYRQVNCFELCFEDYVKKYALKNEISENEARSKVEVRNYDKEKNCKNVCPLECESTSFSITETKFNLNEVSIGDEYSKFNIPLIKQKLNITVNSTEEYKQNSLVISVIFDSLKYTKITQTPKTTLSTLISNLGGSAGLFLDLSFLSACSAIEFILGSIFRF